jgi:adenosylmethionine-8-amino-7-oxononanoate aminotransferase
MDHIWHPYTRFSTLAEGPLPSISRGEGIYLFDQKGRRYIDAISSWWCNTLGHGNPRLVGAIREQAGLLQHSILGNLSNPRAAELARALCQRMPEPGRHVMFASDGSCAVDAALKMSLQYHHNRGKEGKTRFLTLQEDYHGDTMGAVSVGYVEEFHRPFEFLKNSSFTVPLPDYESGDGAEPTRRMLKKHAHEIAAVIVEPLCQGAAGMRMYDPRYLRDLEGLCREYDVLLIIDEIAMGFGRTGRYWAFEHAEVDPDIVCIGKGLTGGYLPISAAVCKDYIYETFTDEGGEDRTFYHGHTFGGNPIAAACALEAMKIYEELDIAGHVLRLGEVMEAELRAMDGAPGVMEVRTLGLIGVVELDSVPDTPGRAAAIRDRLRDEGVLLRPLGNVFYLMPPLIISEQELSGLCRTLVKTIRDFIR